MSPYAFDTSLLYQTKIFLLSLITGLTKDESLNAMNTEYQTSKHEATKAFITKKNENIPPRLLGHLIEREDCMLKVSQKQHIY